MHVLALLHFPLQKFPTDADSLTGCRGRSGERVRDFRMAANKKQTRDEKMSDLHTANGKGSPPCAGLMQQMRGRVGGERKKTRFRSG